MTSRPSEPRLAQWIRNTAPFLFLEVGEDGTVRTANLHTDQLLGRGAAGLHFRDVLVDFTESLDPGALAREGGEPRSLGVSTRSGSPTDFLCSFLQGPGATWIVGTPDTAEQDELGQQILALNRDLGLLTRDLQKANAELERLNQLKNQFLGMATHDLRAPLGLISGFTELVRDEAEDRLKEEEREYLGKVLAWSRHMRKLVDEFLNVSVIESGGLDLDREETSLSEVLENVLSATRGQADEKGVELRVEEDPNVPSLAVDVDRLAQALVNLVANAVEFSLEGDVVWIRTRKTEDTAVIEVEDRGVGMDHEDLSHLFSPFGKAKSRKTGGEKSTGLGLVIARKIVEAHGGQISVESTPGEGSLFRVSLPI